MKDVHVVVHVLDKKWQTTAVRNNQFHQNCYESDKSNANMYFNRCDKSVNHVVFVLVLFVTHSCILCDNAIQRMRIQQQSCEKRMRRNGKMATKCIECITKVICG